MGSSMSITDLPRIGPRNTRLLVFCNVSAAMVFPARIPIKLRSVAGIKDSN
jgi:hypothetical protein